MVRCRPKASFPVREVRYLEVGPSELVTSAHGDDRNTMIMGGAHLHGVHGSLTGRLRAAKSEPVLCFGLQQSQRPE
jgi:hypothetical protein